MEYLSDEADKRIRHMLSMPFIWIMTILNAIYCLVGILENNI